MNNKQIEIGKLMDKAEIMENDYFENPPKNEIEDNKYHLEYNKILKQIKKIVKQTKKIDL